MKSAVVANSPLPEPPWGALLAVYFMLIGIPSGITLVAWWLRRQHGSAAVAAVERRGSWIALAALISASLILVVDLGRPERFYLMLTRFDNLDSPIAVGAKLIALKMFLLAIVLYVIERRRRTEAVAQADGGVAGIVSVLLPWLLVATSFGLAIYPASVLARSWASPLAGSSGAALIFLLTTLLMGVAVTVLITVMLGRPRPGGGQDLLRFGRRALLVLLGLFGLTLAFEGLSLRGNPPDRRVLDEVLTGGLAATFWGLVIVVGMAVPIAALSLAPARRASFAVSAAAVLTGAAATRYLIFAAG